MRIFLAGASGVIGQRLIPISHAGHVVGGMTRSTNKTALLCQLSDNPFFATSSTEGTYPGGS